MSLNSGVPNSNIAMIPSFGFRGFIITTLASPFTMAHPSRISFSVTPIFKPISQSEIQYKPLIRNLVNETTFSSLPEWVSVVSWTTGGMETGVDLDIDSTGTLGSRKKGIFNLYNVSLRSSVIGNTWIHCPPTTYSSSRLCNTTDSFIFSANSTDISFWKMTIPPSWSVLIGPVFNTFLLLHQLIVTI